MKKITVLAFDKTAASTFVSPLDIFNQAGILWNRICGLPTVSYFNVELVTVNGALFECRAGYFVKPHRSLHEITDTDLIIISSIGDIPEAIKHHEETIPWLCESYGNGSHIASVCTGAFLLAETGLLDGKTATTHWGFAPLFKQRYPHIDIKPERMITDEGDLFCSAGFSAGIDLSLYLVEKYCGREVALQCAKGMLYDTGRSSQAPYSVFMAQKEHGDPTIISVQNHIETNFQKQINLDWLAKRAGMSIRNFERRFKSATGDTPIVYLQRVRVETGKRLLEETRKTFDEITYLVGYEDSSYFRKVFVKQTGLRPQNYRKKFQTIP